MKKILSRVALLFVCSPVFAYQINTSGTYDGTPTGTPLIVSITQMEVKGVFYDISMDQTFGTNLFIGDLDLARDINNAISNILSYASGGALLATEDNWFYGIKVSETEAIYGAYGAGWTTQNDPGPFEYNSIAYARISAVPVPAALWLFASGLGLVGFARRKTN